MSTVQYSTVSTSVIATAHVAVTVLCVFVSKWTSAQPPQRGANQFPDVNSATAEVISRAVVVRTYCALHRHVLYCGELGRGRWRWAQSSSGEDDVKDGA
jgi:hypothetical protein